MNRSLTAQSARAALLLSLLVLAGCAPADERSPSADAGEAPGPVIEPWGYPLEAFDRDGLKPVVATELEFYLLAPGEELVPRPLQGRITGTRLHQNGSGRGGDRLALCGVEAVENIRNIHA